MQHATIRVGARELPTDQLSVLLVDDDADDRLLISELLATVSGVGRVDAVGSFAEARQAIFERRHNVYLVDYRLGARTGLELIAESENRANGPFIVLTGHQDPAADQSAAAAGAFDYLEKHDLTAAALGRAIRYATTLWRTNRQLIRRSERQESLARLSRLAVDTFDLATFLPVALDVVVEVVGAECGSIMDRNRSVEVSTWPCRNCESGSFTPHTTGSSISKVIADGVEWGVLEVHTHRPEDYGLDDVTFVEAVTNLIAAVAHRDHTSATRNRLAEILEATPDVSGTITTDGVVTYLNRAARAIFGIEESALPSDLRFEGFHPAWAVELIETTGIPAAVAQGWWSGRSAVIDVDGNEIPVSQVITAHRNRQGQVTHLSMVAHDLSESLAAAKALASSEAIVTKAYHESPIGKAILSASGEIVSVNRAFENVSGYSRAELVGLPAASLVHPEDYPRIGREVEVVLGGESPQLGYELRLVRKNGEQRWVLATVSVISDDDDRIQHVVVQMQDIHASRQAAEQIGFQASLLDQVHNAVIATDFGGQVTYWNRSATEMFGWTSEEAVGRSIFELTAADPEAIPEAMAAVAASLVEKGTWEGEGILRRKDGSTLLAWMSDSLLLDPAGEPIGVVGVKADVTDLRRMEGEARRHETVAASVLKSVHFPVAVLDPQGMVTAVNRAWTQFALDNGGSPEATGVGVNYLDVCRAAAPDPGALEALHGIQSVLDGTSTSFALEYECSAPGEERWFELEANPIPEEGAVVAHWNITAERLHRMALQETIDAKDRFIASLSHELRTPLTAVVGLAEELRQGTFGPEETREFQALIADQARELSLLVDDLLIAARLDSGTLTFRKSVVDFNRELDHVLAPWRSEASRDIRHEVRTSDVAWADPGRVRQILRNLVSNAIRYGADPIELRVTSTASEVVVAVTDHGPGIPESARERMFQPYSTFAITEGLTASVGLGLHVSRDLAIRMGGSLDYRRDDGVTIFELILPLLPPRREVHPPLSDR